MGNGISESEFYMWRAIFAMAHADHKVTREEQRFMYRVLDDVKFSDTQKEVLKEDIETPRSVSDMFAHITDMGHRSRFFYYARMLTWCDGDFAEQEQRLLTELGKLHHRSVDFDQMIQGMSINLEIEGMEHQWLKDDVKAAAGEKSNALSRFVRRFTG